MKRHAIVGCLGPLDRPSIVAGVNEAITTIDLVSGQKRLSFGIGDVVDELAELGLRATEVGLDFLVLAALVQAADSRISRTTESQDNWTREIRLVLPVSDADRWNACAADLQRLLNFLSGDRWSVAFRSRPSGFEALGASNREKKAAFAPDAISLFSGGLDSLIGAIDLLAAKKSPLLISHAGDGATSAAQDACFRGLRQRFPKANVARLRMWMKFPKALIAGEEPTTRGQSFLFFSLAVCTTTALAGPTTIVVPENGLISLNVPLDPLRLGSLSTRTTHPFYMAKWNELLAKLGVACRLDNPYWNKTKGEMIAECSDQTTLVTLLDNSVSCASPAKARWKKRGNEHCGYCLPCLIRRAAIDSALGRGKDPTTYTIPDLRAQPLDTHKAEGTQVRSFQVAIARLVANPTLAKILIHKAGPLSDNEARLGELADVYRRGMGEVAALLEGVDAEPC